MKYVLCAGRKHFENKNEMSLNQNEKTMNKNYKEIFSSFLRMKTKTIDSHLWEKIVLESTCFMHIIRTAYESYLLLIWLFSKRFSIIY